MAHLDLEEQEQLDQFKHFWKQYGNLITWALTVVLAAYAGWNGWQYWQNRQAQQASALFDEVERAVAGTDAAKLDRVLSDMKERFGSTTHAQQAALLVARTHAEAGRLDAARAALSWVVDKSSDEGYRAIARLRLAGVLLESKQPEQALAQLDASFPPQFAALAADRRGDIYLAQGKRPQAAEQYQKAYQGLDAGNEYRRLVDVKLASLGVPLPAAPATGVGK